jgi:hypothetical protein
LASAFQYRGGRRWRVAGTNALCRAATGNLEDSLGISLLADIWDAFASKNCDRISSDDLVTYLIGIEDRPWSESNHGKPMTKNQLARRLKPFGLTPKTIRTAAGIFALDIRRSANIRSMKGKRRRTSPNRSLAPSRS